jgi:hypothetical protein
MQPIKIFGITHGPILAPPAHRRERRRHFSFALYLPSFVFLQLVQHPWTATTSSKQNKVGGYVNHSWSR